ncbi:MAG: GntR family transcriptional regulator [Eggerthellales bacterium]|nr:GntR family transcriptional regulator [Eggerthellales bacterium]
MLDIVISNSSNAPIYEQIVIQIKKAVMNGDLAEGAALPSIRALATDLRVSTITTKRAYQELEEAGVIHTVQGRGSFVAPRNVEFMREEALMAIENLLEQALRQGAAAGLAPEDVQEMLQALSEDMVG